MKKAAITILLCLALVGKSLSNPSGFPRHGKSMLYQYFHRPGQNLYVRGYDNNNPEVGQEENGGRHQNGLEVCNKVSEKLKRFGPRPIAWLKKQQFDNTYMY